MRKWFSYDSPLITVLNALADMILINIAFLICCIPILTIGAANSALYAVGFKWIKKEEAGLKFFLKSFISNLKPSILPSIITVGCTALISLAIYAVWSTDMPLSGLIKVVLNLILFLYLLLTAQIFPFLSKFSCTTRQLFSNSLFTAISHPLRTLVLAALQAAPFLVFFLAPYEFTMFGFVWVIFYFSFLGVSGAWIMRKPYAKFIEAFEAQQAAPAGDDAADASEALPAGDAESDTSEE